MLGAMILRSTYRRSMWLGCIYSLIATVNAAADVSPDIKIEVPVSGWVKEGQDLHARVESHAAPQQVFFEFRMTDRPIQKRQAVVDSKDASRFYAKLPLLFGDNAPIGLVDVVAVARFAGNTEIQSQILTIPIAIEQELDITGDAAVALLYPIGGDDYTVRYVPCCNIFGGITMATRVPVNPETTSTGLPEKILSDFMILAPDGLSASTMGMYMDFLLGPDRFKDVTPALYEFNGRAWVEFSSYEVDAARGYLSMHCPDGGTFVIAAKR